MGNWTNNIIFELDIPDVELNINKDKVQTMGDLHRILIKVRDRLKDGLLPEMNKTEFNYSDTVNEKTLEKP